MAVPSTVITFWRALDGLLGSVRPTRWGAVVSDARFPAIWDANYARIDADAPDLTVAEIERDLVPALRAAGATQEHVVAFDPEAARDVVATLSRRGHRTSWDLVMRWDVPSEDALARTDADVHDVALDEPAWSDIRTSLAESFGVEPGDPLDQLLRLEREILAGAGKRWFGVRADARWVSLGALLVLEGVGYVDDVATDRAFRRRGYGSAVTSHAVHVARSSGVDDVFLLADPDEAATVALYERLGFREAGKLVSTRGPLAD